VAGGSSDDISTNGAVVTTLDPTTSKIAISADGRFVSYTLTNVYYGESIQLRDSENGLSTLVSGTNVNAYCDTPQVDQTGRHVAFLSDDQFLTPNNDGNFHVYARDTLSNTVQLVDVAPNGTAPISSIQTAFFFSADGSTIGFDCLDGSLSINPYKSDAFVRSFTSNMTDIISVPAATLPCYTPPKFKPDCGLSHQFQRAIRRVHLFLRRHRARRHERGTGRLSAQFRHRVKHADLGQRLWSLFRQFGLAGRSGQRGWTLRRF
jgi:hypothetical protein